MKKTGKAEAETRWRFLADAADLLGQAIYDISRASTLLARAGEPEATTLTAELSLRLHEDVRVGIELQLADLYAASLSEATTHDGSGWRTL